MFVSGLFTVQQTSHFATIYEESSNMMQFTPTELWKRHAVLLGIYARSSNTKISECLGINLRTVQRIRKEFDESNGDYEGTAARKPHSDRSDKKRTPEFVAAIQAIIDKNPSQSIRSIARNMGVSEFLIRQVVHENIRYFSYKMRRDQFLSQAMKDKRKDCAIKVLNKLKHPLQPNTLWFFSDEKCFCQNRMVNSQNDRWFALYPQDVPILMKTKHPVHIMVFGVVSSDGDIMPPFIFPHGLKLNTEAYIKCLEKVVLPWIVEVATGRPYVWQQDSAPSHTSWRTQSWLSENFCDHITPNMWPPNSPDCNPLDYYVWGAVERETNKTPCNTQEELEARITAAFSNLNKEMVGKACKRFQSRLEAVVKANGNFFE